jgi:hypothetical protein
MSTGRTSRRFATLLLFVAAFAFAAPCLGSELIEPTRTLGGPEKTWGGLTVFSEPPQLAVYLDGEKVGTTPLRLRQVETGSHKLKIEEVEKDIRVSEGKTARIGLFKGSLVTFSEVEDQKAAPEPLKEAERQRPPMARPPEELKTEDLTLWEKFVNGTLKHF